MPDSQDEITPASPRNVHTFVLSRNSKRWMKNYRTEIAASSSSVLSTLAAVSHARPAMIRQTLIVLCTVSIGLGQDPDASVRSLHTRNRNVSHGNNLIDITSNRSPTASSTPTRLRVHEAFGAVSRTVIRNRRAGLINGQFRMHRSACKHYSCPHRLLLHLPKDQIHL